MSDEFNQRLVAFIFLVNDECMAKIVDLSQEFTQCSIFMHGDVLFLHAGLNVSLEMVYVLFKGKTIARGGVERRDSLVSAAGADCIVSIIDERSDAIHLVGTTRCCSLLLLAFEAFLISWFTC